MKEQREDGNEDGREGGKDEVEKGKESEKTGHGSAYLEFQKDNWL